MKKLFRNDFMRWHFAFLSMYLLTFLIGWLREYHSFFYTIHPYAGIASVVVPMIIFALSKNKKMIIRIFKSNYSLKGRPVMIAAKVSTLVIMFYYLISIITGGLLFLGLYASPGVYNLLSTLHSIAKLLVPLAILTHVTSRLLIKFNKA